MLTAIARGTDGADLRLTVPIRQRRRSRRDRSPAAEAEMGLRVRQRCPRVRSRLSSAACVRRQRSGIVYALDASTGCTRWSFKAAGPSNRVRRRHAASRARQRRGRVHRKLVFFGVRTATSRSTPTAACCAGRSAPTHTGAMITGAPKFHEGRLYVPVSGEEARRQSQAHFCTFRGSVVVRCAHRPENLAERSSSTSRNRRARRRRDARWDRRRRRGVADRGRRARRPLRRDGRQPRGDSR